MNKGVNYYTANFELASNEEPFQRADLLIDNLLEFIESRKQS
jgi:hypothetical protein